MKIWIALTALLLCGCVGGAAGSYELDHGVASYDNLKAATDKCHADGGQIVLKSGYDNRELSNYECKLGGAK
jgi:predicted kinase